MIKFLLKKWANRKSLKEAVKRANHLRATNFKKYHVIFLNGEYHAVSRQKLKELYKKKTFKKGVSFNDLNKYIAYTTK